MRTETQTSDQELWSRLGGGDPDARTALLERHIGLVHHVARRMIRGMPETVELDDLVSMGTLGLMRALDQFEPQRGLQFSTYAVPRVRGAILDELRRQDWVPRSVRTRGRQLDDARTALGHELGRAPTPAETATALGIDTDTLWRWQEDRDGATCVRFDSDARQDGESTPLHDLLADPASTGFLDSVDLESDVHRLRDALADLPVRERSVLALYYFEELTLREIGEVLGLTESRISQIRSRALRTLQEGLTPVLV